MEPLTVIGAIILFYCARQTVRDELRCWRRYRSERQARRAATAGNRVRTVPAAGRAGVAAGRWPALAAGSV